MITELEQDISDVLEKHGIYVKQIAIDRGSANIKIDLKGIQHHNNSTILICTHIYSQHYLLGGRTIWVCTSCGAIRK